MQNKLLQLISDQHLLYLGSADLHILARYQFFKDWLKQGHHGSMSYLEKYQDIRQNPALVMDPPAQSVLVVGLSYKSSDAKRYPDQPQIAQYAKFQDYHKVLKKKAQHVADGILENLQRPLSQARVCVDTAPILERALAEMAGEGFIGKNTCLIHPDQGSLFCLGFIFFSFSLEGFFSHKKTDYIQESCGTCKRCQIHCPTGALDGNYRIDASKCLSYWTIEHRGEVPKIYWSHFKTFWYGCDICQLVCPFNRNTDESKEQPLEQLKSIDLFQVATMDHDFYVRVFSGTAMTRAKIHGLKRNALIALWASKDPRLQFAIDYIREKDIPYCEIEIAKMLEATIEAAAK